MESNYEVFLKTDMTKYTGKWIAIADGKIVAVSDSPKDAMEKAMHDNPKIKVTLVKIPEEETMIF